MNDFDEGATYGAGDLFDGVTARNMSPARFEQQKMDAFKRSSATDFAEFLHGYRVGREAALLQMSDDEYAVWSAR